MAEPQGDVEAFTRFVERHEPRLRHALGASFGVSLGSDACAAALSWAWETWPVRPGSPTPSPTSTRWAGRRCASTASARRPIRTSLPVRSTPSRSTPTSSVRSPS